LRLNCLGVEKLSEKKILFVLPKLSEKKIVFLSLKNFEKLAYSVENRGMTVDQLLQKIILENALKRTCHGCGLEDAEKPGYPSVEGNPCAICARNPKLRDRWNEAWTMDENRVFIER
jgi:hypothetical protein